MSLITKGMGSNRLVSSGYGYSFSWGGFIASVGGTTSGAPLWSWERTGRSRRDTPLEYLARRPRKMKKVQSSEVIDVGAFGNTNIPPRAVPEVEVVPVVEEAGIIPEQVIQVLQPRKRLSTGTKVVIVAGVGILCGTTIYYFLRKKPKSRQQSKARKPGRKVGGYGCPCRKHPRKGRVRGTMAGGAMSETEVRHVR